jgi:HEAT repeat protein
MFSTSSPACVRRSLRHLAAAALCAAVAVPPAHAQTRQAPVDSLVYDLKNPDPVRRREAATLIGQNKVQRATPDLVAAVGDSDPSVRRAIVTALQQVEDPRAIPGFVTLSRDPERDIREKSIEGMTSAYLPRESGLGVTLNKVATIFNPWSDEWAEVAIEPDLRVDPSVIEALRVRLRDDGEARLRAKAARSLGILRAREAGDDLIAASRNDRVNDVRFEAVRALRKIGNSAAGAQLVDLISYGDARVRNEAVYTIGRLRYAPAVPALTAAYEREIAVTGRSADKVLRERLLGALAYLGDPSSRELFLRERANEDAALRLHAYEGLARIADPDTMQPLSTDRLREKDPRILTAQAWGLYRLGRKEFLTAVVDALGSRRTNEGAREYLLELRQNEVPDLFPFAHHDKVDVREAIAEILGHVGDEQAIPTLRDLTRDTSGQVSALASQAIRRINARTAS